MGVLGIRLWSLACRLARITNATVETFVFNSLDRVPFPLDSSILTTVVVDGHMHYDS